MSYVEQQNGTKIPTELYMILQQPIRIEEKHQLICEWFDANCNDKWGFSVDMISEWGWDYLNCRTKSDKKKYIRRKKKGMEDIPRFMTSDPRMPVIREIDHEIRSGMPVSDPIDIKSDC